MSCRCQIIPEHVFRRLARSTPRTRTARVLDADFEATWRSVRALRGELSSLALRVGSIELASAATVLVFDCHGGRTLPGVPVTRSNDDPMARGARVLTEDVVAFFAEEFGRNSVDGLGKTLMSSVNFGRNYNNAFWNGGQMVYGNGDGVNLQDFALSSDVVCHELTHGLTQYAMQLDYADEAGALNESMSDVFGSMFRQWLEDEPVHEADWLIGADIIGPVPRGEGVRCLRDMRDPSGAHCLAPQISHYREYQDGMDPHVSSGVPNLAFYRYAQHIGGASWVECGQVWFAAMTRYQIRRNLSLGQFAARTRRMAERLYPRNRLHKAALDDAWGSVGL